MRNVAIYVRVSTMHQAEQGYSIDSQLVDCRKKAHDLGAITINPLFSQDFNLKPLENFCNDLNIPFHSQEVDIAGTIKEQNGKDPCFTCAFFRRGAINRFAKENNYNKIAYAHHNDDAVETFFMSLLYSGQLKTFLPKTYLDRMDLTVIRPLVYFREFELQETYKIHGLNPIASPCPINGKTKRQEVKDLIKNLDYKPDTPVETGVKHFINWYREYYGVK